MNTNGDYIGKLLQEALVEGLRAGAGDVVNVYGEDKRRCIKNALRVREEFELKPLGQAVVRKVGLKYFGNSVLEPVFVPRLLLYRVSHRKVKGWKVPIKEEAMRVVEMMNTSKVGVERAIQLLKELENPVQSWMKEMTKEEQDEWEQLDQLGESNAVSAAIKQAKRAEIS